MRAVMPWGCTSTSAPICWRALTWKSTGRRPMRSPPTSGTKASWARWSSGPSSRIGMRLRPENSSGTRGVGSGGGDHGDRPPSISTSRPIDRRMSAVMPTSPTAGALVIVDGVSAISAATMCLVTAFLEPATRTSPRSGPLGSMCQAGPPGSAVTSGGAASMDGQGTPGPRVVDTARRRGSLTAAAPIDHWESDGMTNTQRWGAEAFGTFWLVLGGCGTAVIAGDAASGPSASRSPSASRCYDGLRRRAHLRRPLQPGRHHRPVDRQALRAAGRGALHRRPAGGRGPGRRRPPAHRQRHRRLRGRHGPARAPSRATATATSRRPATRCSPASCARS